LSVSPQSCICLPSPGLPSLFQAAQVVPHWNVPAPARADQMHLWFPALPQLEALARLRSLGLARIYSASAADYQALAGLRQLERLALSNCTHLPGETYECTTHQSTAQHLHRMCGHAGATSMRPANPKPACSSLNSPLWRFAPCSLPVGADHAASAAPGRHAPRLVRLTNPSSPSSVPTPCCCGDC
jgi:hypothetical protein